MLFVQERGSFWWFYFDTTVFLEPLWKIELSGRVIKFNDVVRLLLKDEPVSLVLNVRFEVLYLVMWVYARSVNRNAVVICPEVYRLLVISHCKIVKIK